MTGIPKVVAYGDTFDVTVNQPDVSRVCLIAPANVTHGFDQNQRYVPLPWTVEGSKIRISAPSRADLAPPGPYMLFISNAAGVPSMGCFVFVSERLPNIGPDSLSSSGPGVGGLDSVTQSDNAYWKSGNAGNVDTTILVKGTCPRKFIGTIQAQVESAATGVTYGLDLYNYEGSRWESVASGPETPSDSEKTATLAGYASRFVRPGTREMLLRMTWHTAGHPGASPHVDKVSWRVTR